MWRLIQLENGVTLLVQPMPHMRSVSVGVWAAAGSAGEPVELAGVSHFLEHMLFKGTATRTALEIASSMERVGGVLNAFTAREYTCYYAKSLDEHFSQAVELLADMYHNSLLAAQEFDREKNVIIEEINMYEDSPDDTVVDLLSSAMWPQHPYGRPIAGTVQSVQALTCEQLTAYYRHRYVPTATVVAVAGNIETPQAEETIRRYFAAAAQEKGDSPMCPPTRLADACAVYTHKDIEQTHVCLGLPGVSLDDGDYYPLRVLVNALGGGASSRLFQEVREKRGLSYSAYAFADSYKYGGNIIAYASTRPANVRQLIEVMAEQIAIVAQNGLNEEETNRSITQIKGNLFLSMESTSNVMNRLARTQLNLGRVVTAEETAEKLMAVTSQDIQRVCRRLLRPGNMFLAIVGPENCSMDVKTLF